MKECDVSVVIPTYNRTSPLRRALNSIAQQTVQPSEVIIIDDCSEATVIEEVKTIVSSFSELLKIKLMVNERNSGANYSRNTGVFAANGRYIAFLDSDDLWLPEKLERQIGAMEKAKIASTKPIFSATGRYRVDGRGELIARQFGGHVLTSQKIRRSNFIGTLSSVIVETAIARQIHGFNEALPASQDWDFFIRLSDYVQYVGVAQPLCAYADHDNDRISLNYRKKLQGHIAIYKNHIRHSRYSANTIRAEFLQHIAEDYQELGNRPKAAFFYANSIAARICPGLMEQVAACVLRASFHVLSLPSLRQRRYQRYRRSLDHLLKNEETRAVISEDRRIIRGLMA
ncbi:glycosyltransferase family 2 protein [Sinorhizobium fredii]|nr:glycosyltransferase family 2 protein [Sinorhizobium fredii]